ncbi:MAG: hypothetical protein ACRELD_00245 [Longimicrobiales bacterium]
MMSRLAIAWLLGSALVAGPLAAQRPAPALTLYSGGLLSSGFQGVWILPAGSDAAAPDARRYGGRLAAEATAVFGGAAAFWLNEAWGARVQLGYAPSRLEVRMDPADWREIDGSDHHASAGAFNDLDIVVADLAAVFSLPLQRSRVRAYALLGAGVASYSFGNAPQPQNGGRGGLEQGRQTEPAAVFGVGATVPLEAAGVSLFFELSDHLSRTPLRPVADETIESDLIVVQLTGMRPSTDPTRLEPMAYTNIVRLVAGFTLHLGR